MHASTVLSHTHSTVATTVPATAKSVSAALQVLVISADGTVLSPGLTPSDAAAAAPRAGGLWTDEGEWTFGTPAADTAGDYPLLLNGSASGLAANSAQVTNGNLYAFNQAGGHHWCRFAGAWHDVGADAPKEGTVATAVTLSTPSAMTQDNAPAGTVIATVSVTMSPAGAPFSGALVSSNPLYTFDGMNLVLARALTSGDIGTHTTTITALVQ